MPIRVDWDNPERTRVIVEFNELLTWSMFHEAIARAHTLIGSIPSSINLIIWDKVGLPEGSALTQFRSAFQSQPANIGHVFIVSEQSPIMMRFMRQLAAVIQKISPMKSKIIFASSLEEARKSSGDVKTKAS